ncbi:glutamate receptor 2-like [Centruroides vittatus]|uniref:glutamate receptor 2-like n=1 Tax=Centruroides vittatus TaxID=120091 RepID=UPI00350FE87C
MEFCRISSCCYEVAKPVQDKVIGKNENGEFTGSFGQVVKSEADILFIPIFVTYDRIHIIDFTTTVSVSPTKFFLIIPEEKFTWYALFRPFSFQVWLLLFTSLLISAFALFFMIQTYYRRIGKHFRFSLLDIFWGLFSTLCDQGSDTLNEVQHFPLRLATGSWFLAAFVLLSSFSGCLISFLTTSDKPQIPETFHELASAVRSGEYECGIYGNVAAKTFIMVIMTSNTEDLLTLKEHIILNNNYFEIVQEDEVVKLLHNRKFAIITSYYEYNFFKGKLQGNIFTSNDAILKFTTGYVMRKGFPYKREINKIVSYWSAAGIMKKIYGNTDVKKENEAQEIEPLKLSELSGAFILLVIGYTLSLTSFISELLIAKVTKKISPAPML